MTKCCPDWSAWGYGDQLATRESRWSWRRSNPALRVSPSIVVVWIAGERTPCKMTLDPQPEAAKDSVFAAGSTPREFTTISVSDTLPKNR